MQHADGVVFLAESAGDEKTRFIGEVLEDERCELAAVVVIGGDKRREEIKSLRPVLARFVSKGKDIAEEDCGEAEDVERRFFGEVSEEVGPEAGLGDGLEFVPEFGRFEEVQGACGVGACLKERVGA